MDNITDNVSMTCRIIVKSVGFWWHSGRDQLHLGGDSEMETWRAGAITNSVSFRKQGYGI